MTKKLATLSVAALTVLSVSVASLVPLTASANSGVSVNIGKTSEDGTKKGVSVNIGSRESSDGDKNCGVKVNAGKTEDTKGVSVKIGCENKDNEETGEVLPAELPSTGSETAGLVASVLAAAGFGWGIGEIVRRRLAKQNA